MAPSPADGRAVDAGAVPPETATPDLPGGPGPLGWLEHLRQRVPLLTDADWRLLAELPAALDAAEQQAAGADRQRHLTIKAALAEAGYAALDVPVAQGGSGRPAALQALVQFVCGYRDLDLRDAAGLGHGQLLARHGTPAQHERWLTSALRGELIGIAVTEPQGGTRRHAITTRLSSLGGGHWSITGHKRSISRLTEADAFVVICNDHNRLTATVVDADAAGLRRRRVEPAGLSGWSWGELTLDDVRVTDDAILSPSGHAEELLDRHFAGFRPLVAATALGGAARALDHTRDVLTGRTARGEIRAPRDTALVTLARSQVQIHTALLGALDAVQLAAADHPTASTWGKSIKAHGVDTAYQAVVDLAPLIGAPGYQRDSVTSKILADLGGLRLADGVHDELYRSAGKALLQPPAARLDPPGHRPVVKAAASAAPVGWASTKPARGGRGMRWATTPDSASRSTRSAARSCRPSMTVTPTTTGTRRSWSAARSTLNVWLHAPAPPVTASCRWRHSCAATPPCYAPAPTPAGLVGCSTGPQPSPTPGRLTSDRSHRGRHDRGPAGAPRRVRRHHRRSGAGAAVPPT